METTAFMALVFIDTVEKGLRSEVRRSAMMGRCEKAEK